MLLVVDMGNTRAVYGLVDGAGTIVATFDSSTRSERTADELAVFLAGALAARGYGADAVHEVVAASVVPQWDDVLRGALRVVGVADVLFVGPGTRTGISLRYDSPREVGADRVANVVGARRRFGAVPVIVVDFGTATTFDVADGDGVYWGGLILPGIRTAAEALVNRAARLTRFAFERPSALVGRTTTGALQSGLYYGTIAQVEGLVERLRREPGYGDAVVAATGGFATLIGPDCPTLQYIEPNLTLEGLVGIAEMNR